MSKSIEELKAEFLAKGGQVKKVPQSASNGMSEKDWKYAVRGEKTPSQRAAEDAEQRSEIVMEQVREAALMGGQNAAINVLNEVTGAVRPKSGKKSGSKKRLKKSARPNYAAQEEYNRQWGVEY